MTPFVKPHELWAIICAKGYWHGTDEYGATYCGYREAACYINTPDDDMIVAITLAEAAVVDSPPRPSTGRPWSEILAALDGMSCGPHRLCRFVAVPIPDSAST